MKPATLEELRAALADAHRHSSPLPRIDFTCLDRVLEYTPEDMTITVESGISLSSLQAALAAHGQWLPLDPPGPVSPTVADLLAHNLNGPRRLAHGTVRDHVIGLSALLPDGRLITSGGRVVKNVAGYDLAKLFIGSRHTLGLITQVTFKVRPRPPAERFLAAPAVSAAEACRHVDTLWQSPLTPTVLDLHRLQPGDPLTLVIGFSGTAAEVDWQLHQAAQLGLTASLASTPDYWDRFWEEPAGVWRWSLLPSRLLECLERLQHLPLVCHAGNGIVHARGGPLPPAAPQPPELVRRLKHTFDPHHILPAW